MISIPDLTDLNALTGGATNTCAGEMPTVTLDALMNTLAECEVARWIQEHPEFTVVVGKPSLECGIRCQVNPLVPEGEIMLVSQPKPEHLFFKQPSFLRIVNVKKQAAPA